MIAYFTAKAIINKRRIWCTVLVMDKTPLNLSRHGRIERWTIIIPLRWTEKDAGWDWPSNTCTIRTTHHDNLWQVDGLTKNPSTSWMISDDRPWLFVLDGRRTNNDHLPHWRICATGNWKHLRWANLERYRSKKCWAETPFNLNGLNGN